MDCVKSAREHIRQGIRNIKFKIEDLEYELKTEDYSEEGIKMTQDEIAELKVQMETLSKALDVLK